MPQLTATEQARWHAIGQAIDGMATALAQGTLDEDGVQATVSQVNAIDVDARRFLDSLHVPDDAGDSAEALSRILRRIPSGWGRWISCHAGWYPLIVRTDRRLAEIDPDYQVHQIKEKWAALEYSAHTRKGPQLQADLRAITDDARQESRGTCEMCGEAATEVQKKEWIKTLCGACARRFGYEAGRTWTAHNS